MKSLFVIIGIVLIVTHFAAAAEDADFCVCTREYNPICASNGVTYSNRCYYDCEKKKNKDLGIQFMGDCDEENLIE